MSHPRSARTEWMLLACCWAVAVGFIAFCAANDRAILEAAKEFEGLWRASPGNVVGRGACSALAAAAPPLMFDPDGYSWIVLTQDQHRHGELRPHHYAFDNAPFGRDKHWSSSLNTWLYLLGAADHALTGRSMEAAIAYASLWANPVLFGLFLLALGVGLQRPLGAAPTGILLITVASLWGVQWDFSYARPDHHGLHLMAFLGMILTALAGRMGWREQDARRWFVASGLCGAAGLWIGATQQCLGIGALGAGATLGALAFAGPGQFVPELWRLWARVGAAGSLGFYLLEYFPHGMGMRLEVNHPLYALAWLGGGELMWLAGRWKIDGRPARGWVLRGGLALLAVGALPGAMLLGPIRWCMFRDPWLAHVFTVVIEGRPWMESWSVGAVAHQVWIYTGALLATLPLAAGLLVWGRRRISAERRAMILTMLPMTAMFLACTLRQTRWMGFLECSLAVLALVVWQTLPRLRGSVLPVGLLALTVPGWVANCALLAATHAENPTWHARAILTDAMATQEVSWNLRLLAAGRTRPLRVMAPSGPSPALNYFGGVQTVGSFYWENLEGSRATLDFYTDASDLVARRIARERGLDFVLAAADPNFVVELQSLQIGRLDIGTARQTVAYRLANPFGATPPDWLEAVPLQDAPLAASRGQRIYRVLKDRLGD